MITLTKEIWNTICRVNRYLNWYLEYQSDIDHYGKRDYWTYPHDGRGDCEDFSIAKKAELCKTELKKHKIPSFLATCWTRQGRHHVVVLVDTDRGTFCMDNRYESVWHYQDLPYKWDKRQWTDGKWYSIACQ